MSIKLYWCRGDGRDDPDRQNFGDYLSPLMVEALSKKKVVYSPIKKADLIAIGSILPREKKAVSFKFIPRKLHVWGTGTNAENLEFSGRHYYHAVRGQITRQQINNAEKDIVLGDPGLLATMFSSETLPVEHFKLGVIPHYVDKSNSLIKRLCENPHSKLINVFSSPLEVIKQIRSCDFILSSSLHGLIMADSYGIPNARIMVENACHIKFKDYYSIFPDDKHAVIDIVEEQGNLCNINYESLFGGYTRSNLDDIKEKLIKSFPEI